MKIFTSFFGNKNNIPSNILKVSIASESPKNYNGVTYKSLAPNAIDTIDLKYGRINFETYKRRFNKKLSKLDVRKIVNTLKSLSMGMDVVLLCHESNNEYCHRKLVSNWINKNTSNKVEEYKA